MKAQSLIRCVAVFCLLAVRAYSAVLPPSVVISKPVINAQISSVLTNSVILSGTGRAGAGLSAINVLFQGVQQVATGTTNWSIVLGGNGTNALPGPVAGTNIAWVWATDNNGAESKALAHPFFFAVPSQISLQPNMATGIYSAQIRP
jgi:hypothetical protein